MKRANKDEKLAELVEGRGWTNGNTRETAVLRTQSRVGFRKLDGLKCNSNRMGNNPSATNKPQPLKNPRYVCEIPLTLRVVSAVEGSLVAGETVEGETVDISAGGLQRRGVTTHRERLLAGPRILASMCPSRPRYKRRPGQRDPERGRRLSALNLHHKDGGGYGGNLGILKVRRFRRSGPGVFSPFRCPVILK